MPHRPLAAAVAAEAARMDVPLPAGAEASIVAFLRLLARWGRRFRLTGDPRPEVVIARHLPDALALARALAPAPAVAADLGAGAGLPAIPAALLWGGTRVLLVEPMRRRASFMRAAVAELPALAGRVNVVETRAEEAPLPALDAAWSRATWPPPTWPALGAPLVRPGGHVVAFAAAPPSYPPPAGLTPPEIHRYTLADGTPRVLVVHRRAAGG